jgi:hypothetical protein
VIPFGVLPRGEIPLMAPGLISASVRFEENDRQAASIGARHARSSPAGEQFPVPRSSPAVNRCNSTIPRQLPLSPVVILPTGEHSLNVAVQGAQHSDPGMQQWPAVLGCHDESTDRDLPFLMLLIGFWQFRDQVGGILERDYLAAVKQQDRVFE